MVNSLQVVMKENIKKLKDVEDSDDSLVYSFVSGGGNTVDDISDFVFEQVERGRRRQEEEVHSSLCECRAVPRYHVLQQETPIRVLHRRSYATREKLVLNMRVEREGLKDNMFKLLSTLAGGVFAWRLLTNCDQCLELVGL